MRLDEHALRAAGIEGPSGLAITGLTADSRAVRPGFLFAALPGAKVDGARFVTDAVARGAIAVLVPKAPPDVVSPGEAPPGVAALRAEDPRRALALLAAMLHAPQPAMAVAVTGTNGKTSTVDFLRQLWALDGARAASIGTLGVIAPGRPPGASLTTPDPVALHATLAELARDGIGRVAMEASSHGLHQRRLDGVVLMAAGFTNLTRDHLDYHGTWEAYQSAKFRLFHGGPRFAAPGALVANADMDPDTLARLRQLGAGPRLHTVGLHSVGLRTVGLGGDTVRLLAHRALPDGQELALEVMGRRHDTRLALPGRFQADNAMMALALALLTGSDTALTLLPRLSPVRGRMELAARLPNGAAAYVDYAHTPDALARLLDALRPHVAPGARLHVLFGAGGDRDPGKRPLMGAAAARGADHVWVTDDNPRSEDPGAIRRAVLAGAGEGAVDAGERGAAIARALDALGPGDVLAVAGKGHETGQEIGGAVLPFDDAQVLRRLVHGVPA